MRKIDLPRIIERGLSLGVKSIFFFPGFPVLGNGGGIIRIGETNLNSQDINSILKSTTTPRQYSRFETQKELEYAVSLEGFGRFRVSAFHQRSTVGLVARPVPSAVPSFETLGLPERLKLLSREPDGLVLVTGPTGSGKSTTLAALLDFINRERSCHIVTIEDPIEYVHQSKRSIVSQREVGRDTRTYDDSLRRVLRQDPDVIFVGEIRDGNLMRMMLELPETGHLVFSTLHTTDSVQTINRILDFFPRHEQAQVRTQLAGVLRAIASQRLLPRIDGKGYACAGGLMLTNHAVKNLIRDGKIHEIRSIMETSRREGMITLDRALLSLNRRGIIGMPEAIRHSSRDRRFMEKVADRNQGKEAAVGGETFIGLEQEEVIYRSNFEAGRLRYFDGSGTLLETPMGLLFRASGMKGKEFHFVADYTVLNGGRPPFPLQSIIHVSYRILDVSSSNARMKLRIVGDEREEMELPARPLNRVSDGN